MVMEYDESFTRNIPERERNVIGSRSTVQRMALKQEGQPPQMVEARNKTERGLRREQYLREKRKSRKTQ